jgi:hypothetical protein
MIKAKESILFTLCIIGVYLVNIYLYDRQYHPTTVVSTPKVETQKIEPLEDLVLRVIDICNTKLSPAAKKAKALLFANIVPSYLAVRADQEMYALLVCIESKYDNTARSSVGAVGMAQIMPKYAQNFADLCNLGKLDPKDVEDPILNLSLGACFYSSLLANTKSTILAIAAYNAGANSSSVRELAKLGSPVPETASYVAKAALLKEKIEDKTNNGSNKTDKGSVPDGKGERIHNQRDDGSKPSEAPVSSKQVN